MIKNDIKVIGQKKRTKGADNNKSRKATYVTAINHHNKRMCESG
jgi:hypothetical protein